MGVVASRLGHHNANLKVQIRNVTVGTAPCVDLLQDTCLGWGSHVSCVEAEIGGKGRLELVSTVSCVTHWTARAVEENLAPRLFVKPLPILLLDHILPLIKMHRDRGPILGRLPHLEKVLESFPSPHLAIQLFVAVAREIEAA